MTAIVLRADARHLPLPDASVDLIVTSPPYFGLRDYRDGDASLAGQIGSEATPREYVAALLDCTREWVRVLRPSGSIFVNLGDKYAGAPSGPRTSPMPHPNSPRMGAGNHASWNGERRRYDATVPPKSLMGLPWRYALGCIDDLGLILRAEIIWAKPNGLPESVTDRVRRSHEQVFHFTRQPRYYSAVDEVREEHHDTFHATRRGHGERAWHDGPKGEVLRQNRTSSSGVRQYNPLGKLPGSVWEIASQPLTVPAALGTDHFAAYPMELPRRIIAGWSPPGICTRCGEGRRPVLHRVTLGSNNNPRRAADQVNGGDKDRWAAMKRDDPDRITGYACACTQPGMPAGTSCETIHVSQAGLPPTRPAIVADPFGGTGTTALVADALGRTGISFDRSADYCRLARWRTTDPGERAKAFQVPKPPPVPEGQCDLFAEVAS